MPTKNDSSDKTIGVPSASRITIMGPNFTEIYVNSSQGAFSPWDIEVTFGRAGINSDGVQTTEALTKLIFSPQHAKAVLKVFESAVRAYEEQFGEIKLTEVQLPHRPDGTPQANK